MKTLLIYSYTDRYGRANGKISGGPAEDFVREELGVGDYISRLADDFSTVPPDITHTILFGEVAVQRWMGRFNIDTSRGYVHDHPVLRRTIATYAPIDCVDIKDYEHPWDDDDDDDDSKNTGKDSQPTSRRNYRFWAKADADKLFNRRPYVEVPFERPLRMLTRVDIEVLSKISGRTIYFDIETNTEKNYLQCFSYAIDDQPVVSAVVYDENGKLDIPLAGLVALARAFSRNKVVIHNAMFDLPYLAITHKFPFGRDIYDTMLAMHRKMPESEKSLAHAITYYANAPFHKDQGCFNPRSRGALMKLVKYNARDIETLRAVHKGQLLYNNIPGLEASIALANDSIYPYMLAGLHGFGVDHSELTATQRKLSRRVRQYQRILDILTGRPDFNFSSPKQVAEYFYGDLGYEPPGVTKTGAPATNEKAILKLAVKYPSNPVMRTILATRELQKQESMLMFTTFL